MRRNTCGPRLALLLAASLLTTLGACGGGDGTAADSAQEAAWAELQQMKQALDSKRSELDDAREELATGTTDGEEEQTLRARIEQLAAETQQMSDDFNTRLVEYINSDPPVQGEPMTERQQAAIRLKSAEDIVYAREYIREGGDYARAIDIYNAALTVDPDNPELHAAVAEAEANRYMSEERFSQLRAGMSDHEVRAALGNPHYRNIREYDDGAVGWFYPTDPNRSAAAVYFRKRGDDLEVYKFDYRAVVNEGPREVGRAS